MKPVEEYLEYLKNELSLYNSNFSKSILDKVEKWDNLENLTEISRMLFFLYKVEGIRIANYKEWQRI